MVIDELFTNIVSCGYRDEASHKIGISLELKGNTLVIRVMDDGIPFNPSQTGMPVITSYSIHYTKLYDKTVECKKCGNEFKAMFSTEPPPAVDIFEKEEKKESSQQP